LVVLLHRRGPEAKQTYAAKVDGELDANLAGVPGYHQEVVMGVIIVMAVQLQHGTHWMDRR
jgi:hypothetical protein